MSGIDSRTTPFSLQGQAGDRPITIECAEVLRHLPRRRLVLRGRLDGRDVAVKTFFGTGARRRFRRERRGLSLLSAAGVPTPRIFGEGRFDQGWWLAVEWVHGRAATREDGEAIIALNSALHAAGVRQDDPHLGNFVVAGDQVFMIDGDGVARGGAFLRGAGPSRSPAEGSFLRGAGPSRSPAEGSSRRASLSGLALQLAALDADGAGVDRGYRVYCAARNWHADETECARLHRSVARMQRRRVRRFLAKTLRPCTQFDVRRVDGREVVHERAAMCPELERLLASPGAAVETGERLKDGNTATVARVESGSRRYVVKRYNAKSGRARRAWVNGHRLCFRNIPTARPVAVVGARRTGPAYLVLEDLGGTTLDDHVARHGLDDATADAVGRLFEALSRDGLAHRHTKASNFIVGNGAVSLVDLDALRPARSRREIEGDRQRFLENWEAPVAERFAAAIARAVEGRTDGDRAT